MIEELFIISRECYSPDYPNELKALWFSKITLRNGKMVRQITNRIISGSNLHVSVKPVRIYSDMEENNHYYVMGEFYIRIRPEGLDYFEEKEYL